MTELFSQANLHYVWRTLLRLGAPSRDLEDLAQEVFVIAHRRAAEFDRSRRAEPWLYGVARNVLRDHRRLARNRNEEVARDEDAAARERATDDPTTARDDAGLVRHALAGLAEPLQDVIILCDLGELTLAETASELGIPFETAKDRLRRARAALRAGIETLEEEARRV